MKRFSFLQSAHHHTLSTLTQIRRTNRGIVRSSNPTSTPRFRVTYLTHKNESLHCRHGLRLKMKRTAAQKRFRNLVSPSLACEREQPSDPKRRLTARHTENTSKWGYLSFPRVILRMPAGFILSQRGHIDLLLHFLTPRFMPSDQYAPVSFFCKHTNKVEFFLVFGFGLRSSEHTPVYDHPWRVIPNRCSV